jgi:hypothetical protein
MPITVGDMTPYDIVHGIGMVEQLEISALKVEITLARNVGIYIPNCTASYYRRS